MLVNHDILQPIFVGWLLAAIASGFKAYAPSRARKQVTKNGGNLSESQAAYEEEDARIYRLSKGYGALGGWYLIGLILAIHGDYPQIAVTLSWILAFVFFVLNISQGLLFSRMKDANKTVFGFVLMLVSLIMIVAAIWFLFVAFKVIFS